MLTTYHVEYQFMKIKILSNLTKLIIIDDSRYLQNFIFQIVYVSIGLIF